MKKQSNERLLHEELVQYDTTGERRGCSLRKAKRSGFSAAWRVAPQPKMGMLTRTVACFVQSLLLSWVSRRAALRLSSQPLPRATVLALHDLMRAIALDGRRAVCSIVYEAAMHPNGTPACGAAAFESGSTRPARCAGRGTARKAAASMTC
eukprot:2115892-Prymnesium_polylepis.1